MFLTVILNAPPPRSTTFWTNLSWLQYNIFSEALGDRGRWDTARVVTIMLSAFHVSTWGLELSLDLAVRTDGPVDLMNRPPPVLSSGNPDDVSSVFDWIVQVRIALHARPPGRKYKCCGFFAPPPILRLTLCARCPMDIFCPITCRLTPVRPCVCYSRDAFGDLATQGKLNPTVSCRH